MQRAILSLMTVGLWMNVAGCDSGGKDTKAEVKAAAAGDAAKPEPVKAADAPKDPAGDAPAKVDDTPRTTVIADAKSEPAGKVKAPDPARAGAVGETKAADRVKAADPVKGDAPTPDAPASAGGESLAQKEGWADYTKQLNTKIDAVNKSCGSKLTASYDKSTYKDFDPMQDRTQSACQQAVTTLSAICASDAGKESVAKLSKVTCKFSTSGTGAALSGTGLVVKIDPVKSSITGKAAGSYSWASAIKEVL